MIQQPYVAYPREPSLARGAFVEEVQSAREVRQTQGRENAASTTVISENTPEVVVRATPVPSHQHVQAVDAGQVQADIVLAQAVPTQRLPEAVYITVNSATNNPQDNDDCPCKRGRLDEVIVTRQISISQVFWVAVLLVVFWPLFWLPCVIPACYNTTCRCPVCNRKLQLTG